MLKVKSWIKDFERCKCGAILYITKAQITLVRKTYLLTCSACNKKYYIYYKKQNLLSGDFMFVNAEEY